MKQFLSIKIIDAEPMSKKDAEKRLKKKISSNAHDGYLIISTDTMEMDWVSKNRFSLIPIETHDEKIMLFKQQIQKCNDYISKDILKHVGFCERAQLYAIKRHLNAMMDAVHKIENIKAISQITL